MHRRTLTLTLTGLPRSIITRVPNLISPKKTKQYRKNTSRLIFVSFHWLHCKSSFFFQDRLWLFGDVLFFLISNRLTIRQFLFLLCFYGVWICIWLSNFLEPGTIETMNTELCIWQYRVIVGFKATYATSGCHLDIDKEIRKDMIYSTLR